MANAVREIWQNTNTGETFLVAAGTKQLIVASGGITAPNIIVGLIRMGAVDRRGANAQDMANALEGLKRVQLP